jgi:hypothetical protein
MIPYNNNNCMFMFIQNSGDVQVGFQRNGSQEDYFCFL